MGVSIRKRLNLAVFGVVVCWLAACAKHEPVPPPNVKINPVPKEHYEVSLTLLEDPGEAIREVKGKVQYNIKTTNCIPIDYTNVLGGTRPNPDKVIDMVLSRQGKATFVGYLFKDAYVEENYYGLGKCEWGITGIDVNLYTRSTFQSFGALGDSIVRESEITNFCRKPEFVTPPVNSCLYEGAINKYLSTHKREELYAIIVKFKRK